MKLFNFLHQPDADFEVITPEEVYEADRLAHPDWPEWAEVDPDDQQDYITSTQHTNQTTRVK